MMNNLPTLFPFLRSRAREPFLPSAEELLGAMVREWPTAGRATFPIDLEEKDSQYIVTADLPGAKKEEISIGLDNGLLTIQLEKSSEKEEKKNGSYLIREREYSSSSRSVAVPLSDDKSTVDATFKDGTLTIVVPKAAEKKSRKIVVK